MWPSNQDNIAGLSGDDASSELGGDTLTEDSEVSVRSNGKFERKKDTKKGQKEGSLERKARKSIPQIMKRDDLLQGKLFIRNQFVGS